MPASAESPPTQRKVLIVEDERQICDLLSDIVELEGFEACCVRNDEDARRVLDEPRSFVCMIVDVNLGPGVTGYDVARLARSRQAGLPVIYVSGQTTGDSYRSNGVPGSLFVAKPFSAFELAGLIRGLVDENGG
jgi:DNA-binding response OmpR family regulator